MHVRFLTHAYPRWDGDIAGAFIERLVLAVRELGIDVDVVVPADEGNGGLTQRADVPVRAVRYAPAVWETLAYRGTLARAVRSLPGSVAGAGMVAALARSAAAPRVDCVHAHWWIPAGVAAWSRRALGGSPFIITLHGSDVALLEDSRLARGVARRVLRAARAVTTVSSYLASSISAHVGIPRERIHVIPMPLPLDRYRRWSEGGGGILIVGRLVAQKRVRLLLSAIAELDQHRVSTTVIGDGPERPALEEHARAVGLGDRVRWCGAVPPVELPDAMGNADVLVFAGKAEGLGLAVAEALLMGIPVVVTRDGGGVSDLMVEGAGRVVEPTASAIAVGIGEVLADPAARKGARKAASELRGRFDGASTARAFASLYQQSLGGSA